MTSQIIYYANSSENLEILEFAESIGMIPVAPILYEKVYRESPESSPGLYLSTVPVDQLHPFGPDNNRITPARDPILFWCRSYIEGNHLISGSISWIDDAPEVAKNSKKHFGKLKRWIQKRFSHVGAVYISSGAVELKSLGMQLTSIPPSAEVQAVVIP
jgi:hypothetical protein